MRRARFRCSKTGRFVFPLDEVLDLPPGETTVSVARRALSLSTRMAFADLQKELLYQHEVRLSDSVLDRLMQSVGQMAERERRQGVEQLQSLPLGVIREEHVRAHEPSIAQPKRLYVSCDGILYPTRYRQEEKGVSRLCYQEMKCGTVFWQEGTSAWHKRVLSCRDDVDGFGLSLWRLAGQCGMLQADEVIFISDGGSWCESVAKTYFHDATRILDWYHLIEHVWETARVLYPDEPAAQRWVSQCETVLAESSGIGLLRYLRRSRSAREGQSSELAALDDLLGYLAPRVAVTDYVEYRQKGMVIGSGMMESTCNQVVGRRLKGSGRQWSEAGAVAMAALVGKKVNYEWDTFWASRPLHRAA